MNKKHIGLIALGIIGGLFAIGLLLTAFSPAAARLNEKGNGAFSEGDYMGALTAYITAQGLIPIRPNRITTPPTPSTGKSNTAKRSRKSTRPCIRPKGILIGDSYFNLGNSFYNATDFGRRHRRIQSRSAPQSRRQRR